MVKIRVLGGTPEGSDSLCKSCTRGHVIKGFRASEELVFCRFLYIEREIHFPVHQCTFYEDRRIASKEAMQEIAWSLRTFSPTRNVGFVSSAQVRQIQQEAAKSADAPADPDNLSDDRD